MSHVAPGVVRVSTFTARPGQVDGLIAAAAGNAGDALASPGCLSADVCTDPGTPDVVLVISRWESTAALRAFLDRHEQHAHGAVSPYAVGVPTSVHYPVTEPVTTITRRNHAHG
jgi:quinol monooxygenase YgiN